MNSVWLISIGIFLGFFVQTTTGFGAALISLPILLIVFDFQDAMAVLSLFLLLFSMIMVPKNWKLIDKKLFLHLVIPVSVGLFLGIQLLRYGNPAFLKILLGFFTLLYVIYQFFKKKKVKTKPYLTPLLGFSGGFFSGLFSAGGPLYVMAIHSRVHSIPVLRGTIIGVLAVNNFLRVPLLAENGILTFDLFKQSLWILPAFILSLILGQIFYNKINKVILGHLIMALLFIMGIFLIIR